MGTGRRHVRAPPTYALTWQGMYEPSVVSLLPPVLAIALALISRQVVLSLFGGIWLGYCLFLSVNPLSGLAAAIEGVIAVFQDSGNTKVIVFTLLVGGLLAGILQRSLHRRRNADDP